MTTFLTIHQTIFTHCIIILWWVELKLFRSLQPHSLHRKALASFSNQVKITRVCISVEFVKNKSRQKRTEIKFRTNAYPMQRKPTCSSWCGSSFNSFFYSLLPPLHTHFTSKWWRRQVMRPNTRVITEWVECIQLWRCSLPNLIPRALTADSFSLQVTNSPSRVKYVRYLYPQKAFFKRCSPLSSPLFLLSVFISVLFFRHFFPLQFFVLCCSTFISHFACIKEDTMREKKVLLLSLCLALPVVRRHLYSSIRSDKLKIWNWSTFKMFHFKYVSLNSQTLFYHVLFFPQCYWCTSWARFCWFLNVL